MNLIIKSASIFLLLVLININSSAQDNAVNNYDNQIKQGDFQGALNSLNSYIEQNPKDAQAYINRARVNEMLGRRVEKEEDLRQANYLNPLAYMYVNDAQRANNYETKNYEYDFNNSTDNFKKSPVKNKYYNLYLEDQLGLHSQDTLLEQAIFYLSKSDLNNTELILSKITPDENILGVYYDLKGLVELKKNNLEPAIDYFTKAIDNMGNFPLAYHNRAIAYKLQGDYPKAKNDLMIAISLNEDISVFFFTLAKLSERLENPDEAISFYKEAIDKNPDYIEARTNYSILQKTLGHYEEAIDDLMEVSQMMEDNSNNRFINGGIFLTYGEYEKAIVEFNAYIKENTGDCDALFNRGLAKILSGYKVDGCEDVFQSIQIESNSKRLEILSSFCPNH